MFPLSCSWSVGTQVVWLPQYCPSVVVGVGGGGGILPFIYSFIKVIGLSPTGFNIPFYIVDIPP